jgi:hypothetical protein
MRLCAQEHNRKNWLFSNTPRGARASATVYSVIETAKENGLIPFNYLQYLFEKLPNMDLQDPKRSGGTADFDYLFESYRRLSMICYDCSEMDPEVNRDTFIKLVIDRFTSTEVGKEKINKLFEDEDKPLVDLYVRFINEIMWARIKEKQILENVKNAFL